ncbi:MAG: hypothetical protein J5750_04875, partial [Clostridiales bacterium]|nr:hypothetical protein [Clostridiales bacterium]
YINRYENIKEPSWFPDFRHDVKEDFYFSYNPTILQGNGHWTVRFVTDKNTAGAYAERYKQDAVYTIPLSWFDRNWYNIPESSEGDHGVITIEYDSEFWQDASPYTMVYVSYSNLNFNHPHTSAVLVDPETGMIELCQTG